MNYLKRVQVLPDIAGKKFEVTVSIEEFDAGRFVAKTVAQMDGNEVFERTSSHPIFADAIKQHARHFERLLKHCRAS